MRLTRGRAAAAAAEAEQKSKGRESLSRHCKVVINRLSSSSLSSSSVPSAVPSTSSYVLPLVSERKRPVVNIVSTPTPTEPEEDMEIEKYRKVSTQEKPPPVKFCFQTRLNWKMKYGRRPLTSTPAVGPSKNILPGIKKHNIVPVPIKIKQSDCFGFDESDEEDKFSEMLSPIPKVTSRINIIAKESNLVPAPILFPKKVNIDANAKESEVYNNKSENHAETTEKRNNSDENCSPVEKEMISSQQQINIFEDLHLKKDVNNGKRKDQEKFSFSYTSKKSQEIIPNQFFEIKPSHQNIPFENLLNRYGDAEDEENELHVNPSQVLVTYPAPKRREEIKSKEKTRRRSLKKVSRKSIAKTKGYGKITGSKKTRDADLDAATLEWLEKKNKEFQDILDVPLVIE